VQSFDRAITVFGSFGMGEGLTQLLDQRIVASFNAA
jgi:hypothetical protein